MSKEPTGRFHMIAIDATHNYTLDPEDAPLVKAIYEVYLFDNETNHHICSFEKYRWCKWMRTSIHLVDDAPDDASERCENQYIYSNVGPDNDDYITVSTLERLRKDFPDRYKVVPDSEWADDMFVSEFFDSEGQPTDRCWDFFFEYTQEDSWI